MRADFIIDYNNVVYPVPWTTRTDYGNNYNEGQKINEVIVKYPIAGNTSFLTLLIMQPMSLIFIAAFYVYIYNNFGYLFNRLHRFIRRIRTQFITSGIII